MKYLSQLSGSYLKGKTILVRLDFNTEDNWRVKSSLPTLELLKNKAGKIVILGHRGRPKGKNSKLSLKKDVKFLRNLLKKPVKFLADFQSAAKIIKNAPDTSFFLLENLRFFKGEEEDSRAFAQKIAALGDIYVNDAFAVSHRKNASVVAITKFLPSFAGLELEKEIRALSGILKNPKQPFLAVIGGMKVADKLKNWENLQKKAELFLVGGALGKKEFKLGSEKLLLPIDLIVKGGLIKDIGPKSAKLFSEKIKAARTILWNGPVGDIQFRKFEAGTKAILRAMIANRRAYKVVGGGETVEYLKKLKLDKRFNFVSTGGGAMLEFLGGKKLPGIETLK